MHRKQNEEQKTIRAQKGIDFNYNRFQSVSHNWSVNNLTQLGYIKWQFKKTSKVVH